MHREREEDAAKLPIFFDLCGAHLIVGDGRGERRKREARGGEKRRDEGAGGGGIGRGVREEQVGNVGRPP